MCAVRLYTVMLLRIRHDVVNEIIQELIPWRRAAGGNSRGSSWPEVGAGMASWHHHHHRLYFASIDQIVEDKACAALRSPGIVTVARPMQQVKNGMNLAIFFVSRWRI